MKKLGWKKVSSDNLYIYLNKTTSLNVFGYKTHEIAFSGPAIFAVYRDVDVKKLAQEFDIPKIKELSDLSFFRGVKNIYREQGTDEHFGYAINLNLSEMIGKDSFVLLGCSYELDQKDINSFLDE